ncbi:MAG TPA: hypothetical protein VJK52_05795 [Candidatus Nanoarchaeia archaeon]|nr:hypothetical protein [Candidatus Nanoarchaeia archaeon]
MHFRGHAHNGYEIGVPYLRKPEWTSHDLLNTLRLAPRFGGYALFVVDAHGPESICEIWNFSGKGSFQGNRKYAPLGDSVAKQIEASKLYFRFLVNLSFRQPVVVAIGRAQNLVERLNQQVGVRKLRGIESVTQI